MSNAITLDYRVRKKQKATPEKRRDWQVQLVRRREPNYPLTPVLWWSSPKYMHYQRITELRIAGRIYRLLPNVVLAIHQSNNEWIAMLRKDGVEATRWVQHGGNENEALESLKRKVDAEFQRLYLTHAMQRDEADEEMWQSLQVVVDVAEYRSRQTAIHEIKAKVVAVEPDGEIRLEWFGGNQIDRVPPEIQAGNWARATVHSWHVFALNKVISTGEIKHALLLRDAKAPETVCDTELQKRYNRHHAAGLPSADDHPF